MKVPRHFGTLPLVIALHLLGLAGLLWHNPATPHAPPRGAPLWLVSAGAPAQVSPPAPAKARKLAQRTPVPASASHTPVAAAQPLPASAMSAQSAAPAPTSSPDSPLPVVTAQQSPPSAVAASVSAPIFNAAYLNNPAPAYPPLLRRAGEQGKVILRVLVNADGHADEVRIQHSSGQAMFDEAALDAVRKWRFVPARRGEAVVAEWVQVPIEFRLG